MRLWILLTWRIKNMKKKHKRLLIFVLIIVPLFVAVCLTGIMIPNSLLSNVPIILAPSDNLEENMVPVIGISLDVRNGSFHDYFLNSNPRALVHLNVFPDNGSILVKYFIYFQNTSAEQLSRYLESLHILIPSTNHSKIRPLSCYHGLCANDIPDDDDNLLGSGCNYRTGATVKNTYYTYPYQGSYCGISVSTEIINPPPSYTHFLYAEINNEKIPVFVGPNYLEVDFWVEDEDLFKRDGVLRYFEFKPTPIISDIFSNTSFDFVWENKLDVLINFVSNKSVVLESKKVSLISNKSLLFTGSTKELRPLDDYPEIIVIKYVNPAEQYVLWFNVILLLLIVFNSVGVLFSKLDSINLDFEFWAHFIVIWVYILLSVLLYLGLFF